MNPCAKSWLLAGLVLVLASGCAQRRTQPDRPSAPPPAVEQPAEPAPPAADKGDPEGRFAEALTLMKQKKAKDAEA